MTPISNNEAPSPPNTHSNAYFYANRVLVSYDYMPDFAGTGGALYVELNSTLIIGRSVSTSAAYKSMSIDDLIDLTNGFSTHALY